MFKTQLQEPLDYAKQLLLCECSDNEISNRLKLLFNLSDEQIQIILQGIHQ